VKKKLDKKRTSTIFIYRIITKNREALGLKHIVELYLQEILESILTIEEYDKIAHR